MTDLITCGKITANLPSRAFNETRDFYESLGFETVFQGENWMIMALSGMMVEFFPHPDLDPKQSWFSASMRLCAIEPVRNVWSKLNIWTANIPRITEITPKHDPVPAMFAMIDPNGSLWRVMETGELE